VTPAADAARAAGAVVDRLADAVGAVERRETHGSWVLLTPTRAFKVKKPVVMAFLDYGTLERRRAMCHAEVEVNRRAAPAIYLGVRAVVPAGDGVALAPADREDAIEYAVEMRRFPEAATLAAALRRGSVTRAAAAAIGARLAAFHAGCERADRDDGAEAVKRALDDDFASLGSLTSADDELAARLVAAERCVSALLGARWRELDERARRGRVRDGHGDLRAEHVLLAPDDALVDAIEFDPGLRRIDVGLDLGFLVMDLHAARRADLAAALVTGYRAAGGDPGDDRLLALFAAYRARVRAKVALLRAAQLPASAAADERAAARRLLALGERLLWAAREPAVIAVAGVSATGKSTLARALAERSGAPILSSDVIRKRMAGLAPSERAPATAYSAEASAATYRELGRRAGALEGTVIVDATFHRRALRDGFRSALGARADELVLVECMAPAAVLERRLRARERDPGRISDATSAVLRRQLADREPPDELPPGAQLVVRADQPVGEIAGAVEEALDRRPRQARYAASAATTTNGNGSTSSTASSGSAAVPNTAWSAGT
jgi:aminoglycoside phosphotransferase family enzyme/predicted kinase